MNGRTKAPTGRLIQNPNMPGGGGVKKATGSLGGNVVGTKKPGTASLGSAIVPGQGKPRMPGDTRGGAARKAAYATSLRGTIGRGQPR